MSNPMLRHYKGMLLYYRALHEYYKILNRSSLGKVKKDG